LIIKNRVIPCSRWSELIEGLKFHAQLANAAKAVTEFRFLNGSGPILVGQANDSGVGISTAMTVFSTMSPNGGTPLCRHISAVVDQIRILEPQLRASGQKAVVVIATDGESSDGNIADALKPLQHLPALVVVRLCTDAENICNYWNNVDAELELALDVLDDLKGEAEEVYGTNNWLTYAEPLHRLREFGMILKEFDLLDETKLSHDQMKLMCSLLVGDGHPSELPDPAMDWESFYKFVKDRSKASNMVYSPLKNKLQPWIDLKKLKANYGPGGDGCCIS